MIRGGQPPLSKITLNKEIKKWKISLLNFFLPPWIETGLQPAFYDKESGTVLQQTARMYARVNMLIRMFNKLSKNTKTTVEDYIINSTKLHDYVYDYFDNLDVQEEINNKLYHGCKMEL